ncbi:MAG: fumarate hydratase [Acidaminococcales bacterium]|nr:fumarate hydratase [Acidaminococcales bacterium]
MRTITADSITQAVKKLCIDVNYYLTKDMYCALKEAAQKEESPLGREIIQTIVDNADFAGRENVPLCQDTGLTVVFADVGQDARIEGDFERAINKGVALGYTEGYLRKSSVNDPVFDRKNTLDNTPAIIHTRLVPGEKLKLRLAVKGAGSENMGGLKMLKPSDGPEGIIKFAVDTVRSAGSNPCPPVVVGIGIGGTMEKAALLAKESLLRPLGDVNPDPRYAKMEADILEKVNNTGIGPQGLGGRITAIAVKIECFPTHIAQMPVAVNLNCHASRHAEIEL